MIIDIKNKLDGKEEEIKKMIDEKKIIKKNSKRIKCKTSTTYKIYRK